jgi:hypothetical protein
LALTRINAKAKQIDRPSIDASSSCSLLRRMGTLLRTWFLARMRFP